MWLIIWYGVVCIGTCIQSKYVGLAHTCPNNFLNSLWFQCCVYEIEIVWGDVV